MPSRRSVASVRCSRSARSGVEVMPVAFAMSTRCGYGAPKPVGRSIPLIRKVAALTVMVLRIPRRLCQFTPGEPTCDIRPRAGAAAPAAPSPPLYRCTPPDVPWRRRVGQFQRVGARQSSACRSLTLVLALLNAKGPPRVRGTHSSGLPPISSSSAGAHRGDPTRGRDVRRWRLS